MTGFWLDGGGAPVVAFGGNALLPDPDKPEEAEQHATAFAEAVRFLLPDDSGIVLVHGNGPQVGAHLLRHEAGAQEVPPAPLDVLVADTQGSIGYLLSRALRNANSDRAGEVAAIVTQVEVDPADPALTNPRKPVGPFYDPAEGAALASERGWDMVEVPGRGARRVVPSPVPIGVVELEEIRDVARHRLVIAGGGGGIPVAVIDGSIRGIEGVIDKDRTASLIARLLDARGFLILTDVGHVSRAFGTPDEEPLHQMTAAEAEELLAAGEFPPGSMGPKIESCIAFARTTGRPGVITSVEGLADTLAGSDGTRIIPD